MQFWLAPFTHKIKYIDIIVGFILDVTAGVLARIKDENRTMGANRFMQDTDKE